MRRNPRYPALLDAYFACRCVGANDVGAAAANARKRQLLAEAETAAGATDGIHLARRFGAELDDFMTDCTAELVKYAEERRRQTCAEANERVRRVRSARRAARTHAPGRIDARRRRSERYERRKTP